VLGGRHHVRISFCALADGVPISASTTESKGSRRPPSVVRDAVRVRDATERPIDTGTAAGKCFLDMLGVFAEFETNLRRERQLEGIAKAKAAGVYKGRPPSIEASRVRELKAQGMRPVDIAKALKIGRASVYRVLGTASGSTLR
jgi:DNA invertase Pin-like site-specific DNA recombinase